MERSTVGLIGDMQAHISDRMYSKCLACLLQLNNVVSIDVSLEISLSNDIFHVKALLVESITRDCDNAKVAVEGQGPDCAHIFNSTIERVLAVTAFPSVNDLIETETVMRGQQALVAEVGRACDKTTAEFQLMFEKCDSNIFKKVKTSAAIIDLLREQETVLQGTSEQHRTLTHAVKSALEVYCKQAIKQVSDLNSSSSDFCETDRPNDSAAQGTSSIGLDGLLLLVHDATTFRGGLQGVYKEELGDIIASIYAVTKALTVHATNGEDGRKISFMSHDRLKTLHDKRQAVFQLRDIIVSCKDVLIDLEEIPAICTAALKKCDQVIVRAAAEGMHIPSMR